MRSYDVTAEFYDLLHAAEYLQRTERLLDRWLGEPLVGVLDVGAGTGLGTQALAARCRVPIHAVEPAPGMRAILLSRLAGHTDLLSRVTVHVDAIERLGLADVADFALCLNTMACMDPGRRDEGLAALARALVPAATLLVQAPPSTAGARREALPGRRLGADLYGGEVVSEAVDNRRVRWRFTYRVTRGDAIVRELSETFVGHLASPAEFGAQLRGAGFEPVDTDERDVVVARRL